MPVQYEGVLAEHAAVRQEVGVFDVSHLGRFDVNGPGATELVRHQLCNDVTTITAGRAQYTMALNDRGGVVDDIIVWRYADTGYWVMPNGTNFDEILGRFIDNSDAATTVAAVRDETVLVAVQGPDSPGVVESVIGTMPGRFRVIDGEFAGGWFRAGGTGYTGERGAEIAVPSEFGPRLFEALLVAGATPCGLGARDTLRLEMGYPLWGQDLDDSTTPLEAGLGWVIGWEHDFVGKAALSQQQEAGLPRSLVAFACEGRTIPRHGYRFRAGESSGRVTSGNFSPTLGHGIGMGYLAPPIEPGAPIEVEIRGAWVPAQQVDPPFIKT
ncbi:MAG: glycine cleavage system aminomethyltransferase GcvT [Acidimicrobiia bacterium]|nr:MAG: glycine cleavage system aminomethyltransferase GcvT [Acidimicrobiia bacterium]